MSKKSITIIIFVLLIAMSGCYNAEIDEHINLQTTENNYLNTKHKNNTIINNRGNEDIIKENSSIKTCKSDYSNTESLKYIRHDIGEFITIFNGFAKKHNLKESTKNIDFFRDITPQEVFEETGCQVFKNGKTCESYLLYEGELYALGMGFGGLGVVDIITCDFDSNGIKELLYTYSWGSGIHRSCFGYFDISRKSSGEMDLSSSKHLGFIQEDLMLEKVSNNEFKVYTAKVTIDSGDFTKLSIEKDKLFGKIKEVENKPVLFIDSKSSQAIYE